MTTISVPRAILRDFYQGFIATEGCWEWGGLRDANGYGYIRRRIDGSRHFYLTHRLSALLLRSEEIEGRVVDHLCHNPPCMNPDHLRATTHDENMWNRKGASSHSKTGIRGVYFDP
ncbi:HNH endonuclease [Nesterenkonia pannonica]|uniref:HNH endonuclease n=1 Tax=Nesterenkonia pannonica TaxID=1548602 RepID=UPI002164B875|nr:HNH endonuclease [Nesterenkonia pannonica]